ncbi:zinc ribbon domain-containing protein [Filobacillus milosensis]|uniref:Zinc ribbon domain-containing protein n=1 Tax=Filobacillus milosensis TaxID=94137 RepID=A0A4Y8IHN7_9BACI|nr:zinc ribbon domain-containing protein [Filobacillus milosensis]TFB15073.1 zinc ribbon domain-containing protein [Filobacillus milosensis]
MIYCSRCGTANNKDANYCINDGFPLNKIKERTVIRHKEEQVSCQSCGADQLPNAQYCLTCGESLAVVQSPIIPKNEGALALKSIKKNDVKKAFLHTLPLVIITILAIWLLSFVSLGKIDSTPFDYQNIESNMEIVMHLNYFSDYENNKRRSLGEDSINLGHNPEGIVDPVISSLDLMMLSNSVYLETIRHDYAGKDSGHQTTQVKSGLVYYLYLTIFIIFLVGIIYSKKKPFSDWRRLVIYALVFSSMYALIIFILSLFTTHGTEDYNNFTPFTYSFIASDALWKSFLIGFIAIFSGFIMTRENKLPSLILSMKYAVKLLIMTTVLLLIVSGLLYVFYLRELHAIEYIEKSSIISAPVVISQISIVLFNLVFQNVYRFKAAFSEMNSTTQENIASYHMFTKRKLSGDISEGFFDAFNSIDYVLWALLGAVIIIVVYLSKYFSYEQLRDRIKSISVYSAFFSVIATMLSYGATFHLKTDNVEYQSIFILGFSLIMSFIVFFSFTFILTFVSSYIIKTKKEVL